MSHHYQNETFDDFHDFGGHAWSDMTFEDCTFCSSGLTPQEVTSRSVARRIELRNCKVMSSLIQNAMFEDCLVDGLSTDSRGIFIKGCAYRHVTFRGKCGLVIITGRIIGKFGEPASQTEKRQLGVIAANAEYYRTVDWALDIQDAEFQACEVSGIPARLVRRDPETQVIVTRDKAILTAWEKLDLKDTHWPTTIKLLLYFGEEDRVLVAPKRAPNFKALLRGLQILRKEGVAEPD
jgi:hypothetical protein